MTKLNSSFMIGNVEIPHRTVLAPMAGVTNSAFRTIAKEFGAGLVVMEMISEKGSSTIMRRPSTCFILMRMNIQCLSSFSVVMLKV